MGVINIKGTSNIVTHYLRTCERLRDSDEKLIATIWNIELLRNKIKSNKITGYDFLKLFSEGKLTNPESIRRSRCKIQELHPELRGKSYKNRKDKSTNIKNDLRNFPNNNNN